MLYIGFSLNQQLDGQTMFKVEAITPAIGAEVSGVSLNKDLNSDTVEKNIQCTD